MKRILAAASVTLIMCANAIAQKEGRVELKYTCQDGLVYDRINEALLNGHDDLFHERLSVAVQAEECRIVEAEKAATKDRSTTKKSTHKPKVMKQEKVVRSAGAKPQKAKIMRRATVPKAARSDLTDDGFPSRQTFEPVR